MDHRLHLTQQAERFEPHDVPTSAAPDAVPSPVLPATPSIREAPAQQPLFHVLPPPAAPHASEGSAPTLAVGVKRSAADAGLDADAVPDGKRVKVGHANDPDTEGFQETLPDAPDSAGGRKRTASDAGLDEDDLPARKRLRQDEPNQVQAMMTDSESPSQERMPAQDTSTGASFAVDEPVQRQSEGMFLDMMDIWLSAHRGDIETIQAWLDKPETDVNAKCAELGSVLNAIDSRFRPFRSYHNSDDSDSTDSSTDDRLEAAKERHGLPESRHDTSLLKLLLSRPGIDANKRNACGQTALMSAVKSSQSQNVQALLAWPGIDLAARDRSGETALAIVTEKTPPPIVEALLGAHGIKASYQQYLDRHREFTAAAATGDLGQVRSLLADIPWININFEVNGQAALTSAAENAHLETALALLAMPGMRVWGWDATLLARLAIDKGCFQLLRDMLDRPSFYSIHEASFFYPYLELAAANGCFPIVQMLLSSPEINNNVGNDKGGNALFDATVCDHDQIAIVLVAMPWINVNASWSRSYHRGKYRGYPVLTMAAEKGNLSLVRALLAVPAIDVNLANESGHTPLMLAACYGHLDIVQALLAMPGIDVKKSSQYVPCRGDSPEHLSGDRVGRSPFSPRTYYSALKLAKLSHEQPIVEALLAHARPVRSKPEETDTTISDADKSTSPLSPPREQLDPQRASWLEQGCIDIILGSCVASDVQRLLQSAIPLPAWCQASLVEAIALGFTAGHYRAAPAPLWRTLLQTRAWLAGLAFGAKQSRQDVIELDTAISHQLESMKLWIVFLNEVEDLQSLKADPDNAQFEELTLLGCAARDGDLPAIKTLVALGANIHLRSPNGDVPIVAAARAGQWAACAELFSMGAMPVMGDSKGYPALYYIASAFAHPDTATPALAKLIRYLRLKNVRFDILAPNPDERDRKKNPTVLISDILFSSPESWIRFGKIIYGIAEEPLPALPLVPAPQSQPSASSKAQVHAMFQSTNAEAALAAWLDADPQHLHWRDPDNDQTLLHLAAANQNVGLVRLLLDRGIGRTHADRAGQIAAQLLPADYMSSYTPAAKTIADLLR
nr:ankyrin repeat domain-containing protein [uncultured Noviherbaspirillum sp.]